MVKKRKKIGVITSDIYETYQQNIMKGIQREAYAHDYDVVVFSTFLKAGMWFGYLNAEQNIYNMIQYEKLDGIILMPDHIKEFDKGRMLPEILKKRSKGPVVVLDYELEGFLSVMSEGGGQLRPVLDHLYHEHGITDIACMTGEKGHPHAELRLQSYMDFMREHDLPIRENRIFGITWGKRYWRACFIVRRGCLRRSAALRILWASVSMRRAAKRESGCRRIWLSPVTMRMMDVCCPIFLLL